jgi:hypothetical protein
VLVRRSYEQPNRKSRKSAATKIILWSIRADVVRKLDRAEPDGPAFQAAVSQRLSDLAGGLFLMSGIAAEKRYVTRSQPIPGIPAPGLALRIFRCGPR